MDVWKDYVKWESPGRRGEVRWAEQGWSFRALSFMEKEASSKTRWGGLEIKAVGFLPLCSMKLGDSLPPEAARAK